MSPDYVLRLASLADVRALEALIAVSVHGLQAGHYSAEQRDGALGTVFGVDTQLIRDGTYFVVERAGELAGCGGWSRRRTLFGADRAKVDADPALDPRTDPARIRAFFVHPNHARQGIGAAILGHAERAALAAGFRQIDLVGTLTGEALYARFGYAVVERYAVALTNGCELPVVKMTKRFPPAGSR